MTTINKTIQLDQDHEILTKPEVAEILSVTERTVEAIQKKGLLKFYKPSRRVVRYTKRDVLDYLNRFAINGGTAA